MKEYISQLTGRLDQLFSDCYSGISAREDSRAFGAMIEKRITDNWENLCTYTDSQYVIAPGRRTIYDFAARHDGLFYGFDIKTKDLDPKKYSDGGVCAVVNLLKFLANEKSIFVVVEFGHSKAKHDSSLRKLKYINLAPFHLLPVDIYRIENLGTGQVRLNRTINEAFREIEWNRPIRDFFDVFVELAIKHYERVGKTAADRANKMRRFRDAGYKSIQF